MPVYHRLPDSKRCQNELEIRAREDSDGIR